MTRALIVVNVAVFAVIVLQAGGPSASIDRLYRTYGLVPASVTHASAPFIPVVPFITSMFLHGGLMHLVGNMLFMWVFADNVEDRLGHARFLIFYCACGVVAGIVQVLMYPDSTVPTVGASGAISGVLGAYIVLFPRAQVLTLVPLGFFWLFPRLPAVVFLGYWFALQLLMGSIAARSGESSGVAWWAHVGGFAAGIALLPLMVRRRSVVRV